MSIFNYMIGGLSIRNYLIIIGSVLLLSTLLILSIKAKKVELKAVLFLLYIMLVCICYYVIPSVKMISLYLLIPTSTITLIYLLMNYQKPLDPIWDVEFLTNKGKKILRGLARGVAVFGAAGSGKTASIIFTLMKHFAKANFSGIIYDFKNGELTELAVPLYGDRLKVIAVHDPKISIRVNPISPEYLNGEKDINEVVAVIMDNLIGSKDDFFKDSASSLLSAVILKFWFDHQEYCTLPHVISFILSIGFGNEESLEEGDNKFLQFKEFLTSNERVAIQASPFLLGLDSEKQTAAVLATLSNALRKISFPEAFWVLSKNEMDFNINDVKNNSIVSVLNEPKASRFLSPINATIIHSISKQMMVRGRAQSFIMLDEAPTIKLLNMAQIPATMRSFKVATIYCAQDIVQGYVQYGREGFKEIVSNLSTQFFGKSNDPDTSKFYEGYFELTKEATRSITQKGSGNIFSTESSTTTGEREVGKVRSFEFNQLKVGEFAMLSDGKNEIVKFQAPKLITGKIKESEDITKAIIQNNFTQIITEAKSLLISDIAKKEKPIEIESENHFITDEN